MVERNSSSIVHADDSFAKTAWRTSRPLNLCVLGAEKTAWFKDTEGNVLCFHEDIPQGASAVT